MMFCPVRVRERYCTQTLKINPLFTLLEYFPLVIHYKIIIAPCHICTRVHFSQKISPHYSQPIPVPNLPIKLKRSSWRVFLWKLPCCRAWFVRGFGREGQFPPPGTVRIRKWESRDFTCFPSGHFSFRGSVVFWVSHVSCGRTTAWSLTRSEK